MQKILSGLVLITCMWSSSAWAFQTIFLVRHAEKVDESSNPVLNAQGQKRAQDLARLLRDANIQRVFVTEFQRTEMTAKPLADLMQVNLTPYKAKESLNLGMQLQRVDGNVLVVAHSNTLLSILKGLGIEDVKPVADDEFDRLVLVTVHPNARPNVITLRY